MPINTSSPIVVTDATSIRGDFIKNANWILATNLQIGLNNKNTKERSVFWIAPDINIPSGATINSATITFTASLDSTIGPFGATITSLEKDGVWEGGVQASTWVKTTAVSPAQQAPIKVEVFSASVSEILTGTNEGGFSGSRYNLKQYASPERVTRIGQVVTASSNFTLDNIDLYLSKGILGASIAGDLFLEIETVDGSGFPTGSVIATSENRLANDVSTAFTTAAFNFLFASSNQISIVSGSVYAVIINGTYALGTPGFTQVAHLVETYAGGDGLLFGEGLGLDEQNYPIEFNLREITEFSTTTSFTFPFPHASGATVVVSVSAAIVEIIEDAGYSSNDPMMFVVEHIPATTALGEKFFTGATGASIGPLLTVDFTVLAAARRIIIV